jgi:hypothetical protein
VVEHLLHHPKVEGEPPPGIEREKIAIKDCIIDISFYICKHLKIKQILNEQQLFITAVKCIKSITFCQLLLVVPQWLDTRIIIPRLRVEPPPGIEREKMAIEDCIIDITF